MCPLWIVLVVALGVSVSGDDSCPAKEDISPCTCDGEGLNCMGARTLQEIQKAFQAKFKYGGVRSVWVQGTPITNLPAGLFGTVKSQQFYVEINSLTSVDLNAFQASKKTLATLSLFGNKLTKAPTNNLDEFERLSLYNLGRNEIDSLPDSAFSSRSLYVLILAQNKISHIGMNAFSNLPNMEKLLLSLNQLKTLEPMAFAFRTNNAGLQIDLSGNQIDSVSSTAFQGANPYGVYLSHNRLTSLPYDSFGQLITRIAQKGGFIEVSGNPFSCRGCDYSWIVTNKQILQNRFVGFTCTDGRSINDLTKPGIGCNN